MSIKIFFKVSLFSIFFVGDYSFAEEAYVNRFKLFNDFDKFLSKDQNSYEVFPDGNAEFYDNPKYSSFPDEDPKGEYKGTPEFVLKNGRLYHKDKLICDIKDGYPVPVNEERPDNLTERQNEMAICIYLPFVYYKKDYVKKDKKTLFENEPNYSIRVILSSYGDYDSIKYKDKFYYQKLYQSNDREWGKLVFGFDFLEKNKKCRDELFSDKEFVNFYEEVVACGLKKDLECLKKVFGPYKGTDNLQASLEYGQLNPETDNDLLFLPHGGIRKMYSQESEFTKPYSEMRKKLSSKELHRIMLVDNINKLVKQLPTADYVCFEEKKKPYSIDFMFENIELEVLSFYKDRSGKYVMRYSTNNSTPGQFRK
jgi:hypothetical protein